MDYWLLAVNVFGGNKSEYLGWKLNYVHFISQLKEM